MEVSTQLVPPHRAEFVGHVSAQMGMLALVLQPNMHGVIDEAVQDPLPSQSAAVVATELVQLAAAPHEVVVGGKTHAER